MTDTNNPTDQNADESTVLAHINGPGDTSLQDDDISRDGPTEADDDRDQGGHGSRDTGDEPTEAEEDRDAGGEGSRDTGDEA